MDNIKVKVVEFGDRKHYQMQYVDPVTRKKKTRSTGVMKTGLKKDRTAAERVAGNWEVELREGRYKSPSKVTWAEFRERYENEVLSSLAEATDAKMQGVFNVVEFILNPALLSSLTAARLSYFAAELRKEHKTGEKTIHARSENTIKGILAHLSASLKWAVRMGLLREAPTVESPRRAKSSDVMKGRPITGEEFDRMLSAVSKVLKVRHHRGAVVEPSPEVVESWRHYLHGLWWSGLRLAESLELCWDRDDKLCVDLSGKRPMLRIPAELEKGNKDRLLPIAPEFAEFLLQTPAEKRTGYVFNPRPLRPGRSPRLAEGRVAQVVSAAGKSAGVKVSTDAKSRKLKFASAHDLRRSFGERWASRVMPQVLMVLMRHESIETTMKYYVGRNAQTAADVLWDAHAKTIAGNTSGNISPSSPQNAKAQQSLK